MGIKAIFTLEVTCDVRECACHDPRGIRASQEFEGGDEVKCRTEARRSGWVINELTGQVMCGECASDEIERAIDRGRLAP